MHDRAAEWTEVMERWRHDAAFGGIHGRCRVHRAEMLRMSGPTDAAEAEALGACDDLRPWMRRELGWPLAELGNIRLRRGDIDGAEEAFTAAHAHAWCPHPGLARVRLAQGDVEGATSLIGDAIRHPIRIPSKERPPTGDLYLAPLLDAQVEVAVAAGDLDTARRASEQLGSIAATYHRSPYLRASAALARGRVALLEGDLDAAIGAACDAVADWSETGAPYEAALARMVVAEAHQRAGNAEAARMQWRAAATALDEFGAAPAAAKAAALADGQAPRPEPERGSREGMFRRQEGRRRIVFDGADVSLRDLKGFRYLERLLADPDREFHVLDLVSVDAGTLPTCAIDPADELVSVRGADGLPTIDDEAREAYRRRLHEVEADLEEARAFNDLARMELAERDRDFLVAELSHATGLGGRLRSTGSDVEKARGSVGRCLRYAIGQLAGDLPSLADHLRASLHSGSYCTYRPDPLAAVTWQT
jgi:tetratricopeptide (TPR) repeat protein